MSPRIVFVEDDATIAMAVGDELQFEGFDVEVFENGQKGLQAILQTPPDLVLLDIMLPGRNGFEVCRQIRAALPALPILILTARGLEVDKVRGLDLGADDYVTKPFGLAELMARVRALLRRSDRRGSSGPEKSRIGELELDVRRHQVSLEGRTIDLTPTEFQLLAYLFGRKGEVVSRDEFLDSVWGEEVFVTHRTVDAHIAALRRKIETDPNQPRYILGVRGVGYKLIESLEES